MRLLPPATKSSDIKFVFAKSIGYSSRISLIICMVIGGILTEIFYNFWIGLTLTAIGSALGFIKGYDPGIPLQHMKGKVKWNQVTPDEFKKVIKKAKELKKWDRDMFDITNPLGIGTFLFLGISVYIVVTYMATSYFYDYVIYFIANCIVLIAPHFVFGTRSYLKQDKLLIKIKVLQKIMEALKPLDYVQVLPMLEIKNIKGSEKSIPQDARLMLRFLTAPDYFLGIQAQIAINNVQGKDFPYLYSVIVAKREANFFKSEHTLESFGYKPDKKIPLITEYDVEGDVDILIIRQETSGKGYFTENKASRHIVLSAIKIAKGFLKVNTQE